MKTTREKNMFRRTMTTAASMVALAISLAAGTAQAAVNPPINVVVPPLAFEDTHITVSWQKPTTATGIVGYNVYLNGTKKGSVSTITWASGLTNNQLYYDITGLTANTSYSIKVRSYDSSAPSRPTAPRVTQSTTATPAIVYVHSYASQSGMQTSQVQAAINACAHQRQGRDLVGRDVHQRRALPEGQLHLPDRRHAQGQRRRRGLRLGQQPLPAVRHGRQLRHGGVSHQLQVAAQHLRRQRQQLHRHQQHPPRRRGHRSQARSGAAADSANSGYYLSTLGINERTAQAAVDTARGDLISITGSTGVYISKLKFTLPAMHMLFIARTSNLTIANINADSMPSGAPTASTTATASTWPRSSNGYVFGSTFNNGDDCINMNAGTNAPGVYDNKPISNMHIFNNYTLNGHGGVGVRQLHRGLDEERVDRREHVQRHADRPALQDRHQPWRWRRRRLRDRQQGQRRHQARPSWSRARTPTRTGMATGGTGYFKNINVTNLTGSVGSGAYAVNIAGNSSPKHTAFTFKNVNITGSGGKGVSIYQTTSSTFTNVTSQPPAASSTRRPRCPPRRSPAARRPRPRSNAAASRPVPKGTSGNPPLVPFLHSGRPA